MNPDNNIQFPRYENAHLAKLDFPADEMKKLAEWLENPKNFLVFITNPGIGKTYFTHALKNNYDSMPPRINEYKAKVKRYYHLKEDEFFEELRKTIDLSGDSFESKCRRMANYNLVFILDDLGSNSMTAWQKEMLNLFLNERYENMLPLIVITNIWSHEMQEKFTPRIKDRLLATENTILEFTGESKRQLGL